MKKIYEIHDLTTKEILADNLDFDDMPELLGAYQEFYPTHNIIACYRDGEFTTAKRLAKTAFEKQQEFTIEWFELLEENICNVY